MLRTTYDLTGGKNQIFEYLSINKGVAAATLHRKIPPCVSELRTILHYKEKPARKVEKIQSSVGRKETASRTTKTDFVGDEDHLVPAARIMNNPK